MLVHEDFFSPNSYFSTWFLTPRWCWEGNTSTACPQRNTSLPPSTCTWTSSISSSLSCPLLATLGIRSRAKGYAVQRGQGFLLGIWIMFMSDYLMDKLLWWASWDFSFDLFFSILFCFQIKFIAMVIAMR